jgi:hypothetical protein
MATGAEHMGTSDPARTPSLGPTKVEAVPHLYLLSPIEFDTTLRARPEQPVPHCSYRVEGAVRVEACETLATDDEQACHLAGVVASDA